MGSSRNVFKGLNEDIDYYHSGGGYDYSTLNGWEANTDNDNVTEEISPVLEGMAGVHDDTIDATSASGYNNQSYHRCLRPAAGQGHYGVAVFDGSIFAFDSAALLNNFFDCDSGDHFFSFIDLVCKCDNTGLDQYLKGINLAATSACAIGCIVVDCEADPGNTVSAFAGTQSGSNVYYINCISANCGRGLNLATSGGTAYVYNCTSWGCTKDLNIGSGQIVYAKNCIVPVIDDSGTLYKTTCLEANANYRSTANRDFRLVGVNPSARGQGTDLSADGVFPFNDDIAHRLMGNNKPGKTRVGAWDIGASQYIQRIKAA